MPGKTTLTRAEYKASISSLIQAHTKYLRELNALFAKQESFTNQIVELQALTNQAYKYFNGQKFTDETYARLQGTLAVIQSKGEELVTAKEIRDADNLGKIPPSQHLTDALAKAKSDLESLNLPLGEHNKEVAILLEEERNFVTRESGTHTFRHMENKNSLDYDTLSERVTALFTLNEELQKAIKKKHEENSTNSSQPLNATSSNATSSNSISSNKMSQFAAPDRSPDLADDTKPKKGRGSRGCSIL